MPKNFKDVGITRNSDLLESGVDEYAHLDLKKNAKKSNKKKPEKVDEKSDTETGEKEKEGNDSNTPE